MTDLIQEYNLTQLISEPTHFTENSSSLIDLILVRNNAHVLTSGVTDTFFPDQIRYHCPTVVLLKFLRHAIKTYSRRIWNYKLADFDKFRDLLTDYNLTAKVEETTDLDTNSQQITDALFFAAEQSIPNKVVIIRPTELPWINCHIKKLIRKRKRLFKIFRRTDNPHYWDRYKFLRNRVVTEIRNSKKNYFDNLDRLLSTNTTNSKLFWKTAKQVLNLGKTSNSIPTLTLNNEYAEDDFQKASMLNAFFISQASVNDDNKQLPDILPAEYSFDTVQITCQDIRDVLQNLNVSKSCGPDQISPRLLREGADILDKPLSTVFNRSIESCYFPSQWKDGNVTPIHKKDDKSQPSNYRPITLLSLVGKTMERCVQKRLYNYAIAHNLITPLQSGFIQGDSTTYQLLHTYHTFCEAVDSGKEIRVVFCDVSKAFDRVWHRGLLHKLKTIGCSEKVTQWFVSYLSGRRQRVVINGQSSEWGFITAGVPQGSILGPLLFLIFINDIVKDIGASIRLFADDTSVYIVVETPQSAATILNGDMSTINDWSKLWLVNFNAAKTLSMVVSRKVNKPIHPPLFMNNVQINETQSHKHLGVTFSSTCLWTDHIENICEKAWVRLNLMRALKFRISRKSLEQMYISFIRPLLEYCDSVWDNSSTETKKKLETIHIEAARTITGATKLCSIDKLLVELGWETLQSRRDKHKLVIFYKIMNGLTPDYLRDLVPPQVHETSNYNLRNSDSIRTIQANSNLFYNSFLPSTIRAWNSLPNDIKSSSSVAAFKYRLNTNLSKPPRYYNCGSRIGQILHTRLRLECSSLNSHLYRKNIIDDPLCSCGGFESTYHFLFTCSNYSTQRNAHLPDDLHNYSTNDLLYGRDQLSEQDNESLFLRVQEFIVKSERFRPTNS